MFMRYSDELERLYQEKYSGWFRRMIDPHEAMPMLNPEKGAGRAVYCDVVNANADDELFNFYYGELPNENADVAYLEIVAKFLNVFDIKLNDRAFLKLFNRIDAVNVNNIVEKFGLADNVDVENPLNDLANHAERHLNSRFNTERAGAGREKYQRLQLLFNTSKDLDELQNNIKDILGGETEQSKLIKNRGGFFGAYKSFSFWADKLGAEHYHYADRRAVSSTDHHLIALYGAIS